MLHTGFIHIEQDVVVIAEFLIQPPVPAIEQRGLLGLVSFVPALGGPKVGSHEKPGWEAIMWQ